MKLKQVDFENFKSIKEDSLIITHNCMILVGKNEAGKSNVLKGVAGGLSAKAYPLSVKYKRKGMSSEKIQNFLIDSVFQLDDNEIDEFIKHVSSIVKGNFLNVKGKQISNKDFVLKYYRRGVYRYNVENRRCSLSNRASYKINFSEWRFSSRKYCGKIVSSAHCYRDGGFY